MYITTDAYLCIKACLCALFLKLRKETLIGHRSRKLSLSTKIYKFSYSTDLMWIALREYFCMYASAFLHKDMLTEVYLHKCKLVAYQLFSLWSFSKLWGYERRRLEYLLVCMLHIFILTCILIHCKNNNPVWEMPREKVEKVNLGNHAGRRIWKT